MAINSFPPAGGAGGYEFPSELIDPVSKFRVSQPENLIDTDFEYGLQPTKWETVELINNTPSFFSKSGDTTIDGISSIITNAGTREIIVKTELDHGLAVGIPINVTGTKSITADGSYIINSIPDTKTFTYLCKDDQTDTASILDLYSSIITGEFFQGSQLRVSDSEGIITDAAGISELTVTTNSTHGFGENTPFYFLNLNSTVAQEFQGANTASKTFDASNSATAQTFDGSNTLSSFSIDWSNSAVEGGTVSDITSTDTANSRITVSHTTENFSGFPLGTPLYYNVSASSGYFSTNPRGVVFLKTTTSLGTSTSTFQVSLVPDGEPILFTTSLSGTFQRANQARTFAGNNSNPITQIDIDVQVGQSYQFDGGNQGYVGNVISPAPSSVLTVSSYSGTSISVTGSESADYYVGAMVRYETTGTVATGLVDDATYFVKTVTNNGGGSYTLTLSALPGSSESALTISGGTGTQTFTKIGVSLDKDIVHIRSSSFLEGQMLEYIFPSGDPDEAFGADVEQKFYFVYTVYDEHNYKLSDDVIFKPILATGGTILPDVIENGRTYKVHMFTSVGTTNFVVSDIGKEGLIEVLLVGGGGGSRNYAGGGGGGEVVYIPSMPVTVGTFPIVVGAGGLGTNSGNYQTTANGQPTTGFGQTAKPGGGAKSSDDFDSPVGANGTYTVVANGGGGSSRSAGYFGTVGTFTGGVTGFRFGGNRGGQVSSGSGSPNQQPNYPGGGGGGAGASVTGDTGGTTSNNSSGNGGAGVANAITGTLLYWGGGGGGGIYYNSPATTPGSGGIGGGGGGGNSSPGLGGGSAINAGQPGSSSSPFNGGNGGANTGGGGGGGRGETGGSGGNGGSGIVIVRYPITGRPEIIPPVATGGTITEFTESNTVYRAHSFTNVGAATFNIQNLGNFNEFDILMVGGGGGSRNYAGGGGGGEVVHIQKRQLNAGSYSLSVGAGGIGTNSGSYQTTANGQSTTGFGETAKPGGGAKSSDDFDNPVSANGTYTVVANGGGGSSRSAGYFGTLGTTVATGVTAGMVNRYGGNRGGQVSSGSGSPNQAPNYNGGGGGGAGASVTGDTGGTTSNNSSGNGGAGVLIKILEQPYYFGGGGGGGIYYNSPATTPGSGGIGGGGGGGNSSPGLGGGSAINAGQPGSSSSPFNGGNGGANTGGGGGAGRGETGGSGGNGGSGIIVIRYPIGYPEE